MSIINIHIIIFGKAMELILHSEKATVQTWKLQKKPKISFNIDLRGFKAINSDKMGPIQKMLNSVTYTQLDQVPTAAGAGERAQPHWPLRGFKKLSKRRDMMHFYHLWV